MSTPSKAHEHLVNKKVILEATLPIPDGQGGVAFPQLVGTLIAADESTLSVLRAGQTENSVFERCNIRSTNPMPSELAVSPGLVIPNVRGH